MTAVLLAMLASTPLQERCAEGDVRACDQAIERAQRLEDPQDAADTYYSMCLNNHAPACDLALGAAQALDVGDRVERIDALCTAGMERACERAGRLGRRYLQTGSYSRGVDLMGVACRGGDSGACDHVLGLGEVSPHGGQRFQYGQIVTLIGLGAAILGSALFYPSYDDQRCGVNPTGCGVGGGLFVTGSALSAIGGQLMLDGAAQSRNRRTDAVDFSAFQGLGVVTAVVGVVTTALLWTYSARAEPNNRALHAAVGLTPLFTTALSQTLFFTALFTALPPEG